MHDKPVHKEISKAVRKAAQKAAREVRARKHRAAVNECHRKLALVVVEEDCMPDVPVVGSP